MDKRTMDRRTFIQGASAAWALSTLGGTASRLFNPEQPYRVGLIGTGWYGKSDLCRLIQVADVNVLALCDVDRNMLTAAGELVSQRQKSGAIPRLFGDYRQMLAETPLDIVLIGSPDHWHALQAIEAMRAGAHVYVQKPVSVDVLEGEALVAAARKYKRVVQVGTQRRSTPHLIEAKRDIVDAGLLGKVSHAEMCCYYHMRKNDNPPLAPVPDYFDYERWTGPAPLRPFDGLPHGSWWRAFMEYGNGIMGDMCVHMFDAVRWMLGLRWPRQIVSTGGIYVQKEGKSNIADTQTAVFEYDGLNCVWQHRTWGTAANPEHPWAFTLYGDKGTLIGSPYKYEFIPTGKSERIVKDVAYEKEQYPEDLTEPRIELHAAPATRRHMLDFLQAIKTGGRPVADIEEGHISTACCILANLSMQLGGQALVYDPVHRKIIGNKKANALLRRKYRKPWVHPAEEFLK